MIYLLLLLLLFSSCTTEHQPVGIEDFCRTNCQCNLSYCEQHKDFVSGRWHSTAFKEAYSYDGTSLAGFIAYPITDAYGCSVNISADISIIFYFSETDKITSRYGVLYGKLYRERICEDGSHVKERSFSYWYWDFFNPIFISGMILYDSMDSRVGDEAVGATMYFVDDLDDPSLMVLFIRSREIWGVFAMEKTGHIGQCSPGSYHCYYENDCTSLVSDCVNSPDECRHLGSRSYSLHKPEHMSEYCIKE